MADSAAWVVAAESACPWPPGSFLEVWDDQRRDADEFVVESSPLAEAVRNWVERDGEIEGTATELLELLSKGIDEKIQKRPDWPMGPQAVGTKLREVAPNLRRLGIEVHFSRGGARRPITIRKNKEPAESLSLLSSPSRSAQEASPEVKNGVRANPSCDSVSPTCDSVSANCDSDGSGTGCDNGASASAEPGL